MHFLPLHVDMGCVGYWDLYTELFYFIHLIVLLVLDCFPVHSPQCVCGLGQKKGDLETAQYDKRARTVLKICGSQSKSRKGVLKIKLTVTQNTFYPPTTLTNKYMAEKARPEFRALGSPCSSELHSRGCWPSVFAPAPAHTPDPGFVLQAAGLRSAHSLQNAVLGPRRAHTGSLTPRRTDSSLHRSWKCSGPFVREF